MALDLGELVGKLRIDSKQYDKGLDNAEKDFKGFGGRLASMAAVAGTAAALAFGVALVGAMDEQDVGAKIAARMGQSVHDAERYGHLAGKIYADNFGESVADVGDVLAQVVRSGQDLGLEGLDEEFSEVTAKAIILRDVFKQDINKVFSATTQIMRNGLAPNAEAAFDIIARGVQLGVDKSEDLLDTFNEYSTQFRELGLNAEQSLGLMSQALKAGARDSDTVADTLKEFAIRAQDASKLSADGFKLMGLDAAKMTKIFAKGGPAAAQGLQTVLDRLRAMPDPVARNAAAVALFGTKAEDLQDALFAMDPKSAVAALGQVEGAVDKAGDTMASTASANIESFKRQLEVTFTQTMGGVVLPAITKVAKSLSKALGPAFQTVGGWIKKNQEWLGPLAVTLGTFAGIIAVIVGVMKIWTAVTAAYTVVQWALNGAMLANPIGLIIIAIIALVAGLIYAYKKSDTFRKIVDGAFRGIATVAKWLWANVLKPIFAFFQWQMKIVATVAMWLWRNVIQPAFKGIGSAISSVLRFLKSLGALIFWVGKTVLAPVAAFIKGQLALVGGVFRWLYNTVIKPVIDGIAKVVRWVYDKIFSPIFNKTMEIVRKVGGTFKEIFGKISGWISNAFGRAVDIAKGAINGLIGLLNKAIGFINDKLVGNLNKVPGVDFAPIPTLPKLARGGTVAPTPGGRPVIMGDGGEVEYGIPRSDMRSIIGDAVRAGGGQGSMITIVITDEMRRIRKTVRAQGGKTQTVLAGSARW